MDQKNSQRGHNDRRSFAVAKVEFSEEEIKELIQEEILPYPEMVKARKRLHLVQRDPTDNKFLECTVAGKARVIISGDKDLLSLGRYRRIAIQTPASFSPRIPNREADKLSHARARYSESELHIMETGHFATSNSVPRASSRTLNFTGIDLRRTGETPPVKIPWNQRRLFYF
jgi:hypothetical protein